MLAVEGYRADAICVTSARFIRGEVVGHKSHRLPTTAEFGQECKSIHNSLIARENRLNALPKPDDQPTTHTPEHRERMLNLLDLLSRACRGDRAAQKALEPWGWKQ